MDCFRLPVEQHPASVCYRTTNQLLAIECKSLQRLLEKDLGCIIENNEWLKIIFYNGKYIREAKGKFTQYKITHRLYWTPSRLNRMGLINSNLCWKCKRDIGTFLHCIWECPVIQPFWRTILEYLSNWLEKNFTCIAKTEFTWGQNPNTQHFGQRIRGGHGKHHSGDWDNT